MGLTKFTLIRTVDIFTQALFWLILARVILSWIRPQGYNRTFHQISDFVFRVTEPFLGPIRGLLPATGGIDFSPIVVLFLIRFVANIVIRIIAQLPL